MPLILKSAPSAPLRQSLAEAARLEPAYRKAFRLLVKMLRAPSSMGPVRRALENKKLATEIAALLVPPARDLYSDPRWGAYARAMANAYAASLEVGGNNALKKIAHKLRRPIRFKVQKGIEVPVNPYSIKWIKEHGGDEIKRISKESRALIRSIVSENYQAGKRPADIEASIRKAVGLTPRQYAAVEQRRETMVEGGMSEELAEQGSQLYADDLLDQRAAAIARTENKFAQEQGRTDAWYVADDEGVLPKCTKVWESMPESPRLSDICRELDGQEVDLREDFYSEVLEESVRAPAAHPNCRSTQSLRFADD